MGVTGIYRLIFVRVTHYDGRKKRGDTMKIEPISNGNLRIWLAEEEIEAWGLESHRRDGVRRLVKRALAATGRRLTSRMWAEMIPVDGGCVVLVSPTAGNHRQPAVFAVAREMLAEVSARWHPQWMDTAQVYAVGDDLHVVLYGDDARHLLREYGHPLGWGEAVAAHTAEYGVWVGAITAPAPAPPEREGWGR